LKNIINKDPTTTLLHYLVKFQCLEATIENETSVTPYFKKLTTENNVLIVSVVV